MKAIEFLSELSTELLARYKKAAYADAKKADAEGDYERGNKRFKGINKATVKQFDNDLKKHDKQDLEEGEKKGLYYYVNKRKKAGTSRPASHPKAPTAQAWKDAAKTAKKEDLAESLGTMPTTEYVKGIYAAAAENGMGAPDVEAVRKQMVLAANGEVDIMATMQRALRVFQDPKFKQMLIDLDALIKQAERGQGVAEGWKEKVGAGLTAAALATGASGVVLNPARPIGPNGQTVANPYPNKATNTKSAEDDAWAKIEKRKAAEKKIKEQGMAESWEEIAEWLAEEGKASRALCQGGKPDSQLGASQLASCKSQGLRARDGEKSHLIGKGGSKVRVTVGGKKIKGKKYGGPLPDYGTRKGHR